MLKFVQIAAVAFLLSAGGALAAEGMSCCKEKCCCEKKAEAPAPARSDKPTPPVHQH